MSCQEERSAPRSLEVEGGPRTTTSSSCSSPLAVDHHGSGIARNDNDDNHRSNHRRKPTSKTRATVRYLSLSLLALALTLTCPGSIVSASSVQQMHNQNSNSNSNNNSKPLLQCLVVYVLSLALFFFLLGSDPGYLTPENMKDFGLESATLLSQNDEGEDGEENHQDQHPHQQQNLNLQQDNATCNDEGMTVLTHLSAPSPASIRRPYCPTCQISPPLRAHHCKLCDRHVATFDHHCDFVATCIGERNHCRFWWFLVIQAIGFAVFCHTVNTSPWGLTTLPGMHSNSTTLDHVHWSLPLRVLLAKLYLYPLCFFAWIMVLLHTWMATTNSTTFEFSKGGRGGIGRREGYLEYLQGVQPSDLPFSKGLMGNLKLFCRVRPGVGPWGNNDSNNNMWKPIVWQPPGEIIRDSEDWWEHPWQNKYWSCC